MAVWQMQSAQVSLRHHQWIYGRMFQLYVLPSIRGMLSAVTWKTLKISFVRSSAGGATIHQNTDPSDRPDDEPKNNLVHEGMTPF
jgi:hypothetical protein